MVAGMVFTLFVLWWRQPHRLGPYSKVIPRASSKSTQQQATWETLNQCQLLPGGGNDGDSFRVGHGDQQTTFRLYFVDCPEKDERGLYAQRLLDQAAYFQLPSAQAACAVGQAAAAFTLGLLHRPFTVITKWERVFDSQRFYAQVIVQLSDGTQRDLAELLVEQGYARIFTKGTTLPGQSSERNFTQHLRTLESASKADHKGAWQL
jgi:endonuclease YncB( thermonuclease family)